MLVLCISALVLAYLAIGTWAITLGPLAERLRRLRWDVNFGLEMQEWGQEQAGNPDRPPPPSIPRWRMHAISLSAHAGTLLGWPLFLPQALRAQREERRSFDEWEAERQATRPWLKLVNHTPGSDIQCPACGHQTLLPGCIRLMRSTRWADPWQCLDCRRLHGVWNDEDPARKRCDCGGALGRDHITLCPQCGHDALVFHEPEFCVD